RGNNLIRKVTTDGMISTIAGTGVRGDSGDGGPAIDATFNTPMDVKVDSAGRVYVADMLNHKVRRINPTGIIETVAGDGVPGRGPDGVIATASSLRSPAGLAIDFKDDLYIADWQNYVIRKVTFGGKPTITRGGIVNAASFIGDAVPLAAGTIVSIVGTNLA